MSERDCTLNKPEFACQAFTVLNNVLLRLAKLKPK